jgi:hypothetical protein
MTPPRTFTGGLFRASDGSAAVEFAVVAPTFLIFMLGIFDMGQMLYAKSVLEGAVQSAARMSALETGDTEEADAMVEKSVKPIIPGVAFQASRVSYFDFADIKRPEKWNDDNGDEEVDPEDGNGVCDNGETYTDENNNGIWDDDIGQDGNGGASDVVIYTVTVTYTPTFKIPFTPKSWDDRSLTSTAVRKNQPFTNQDSYSSKAGLCT